ncbi:transposable element Tcb2 transposase [Trichonephila clavipes]|nr:transposable element Tcb2 transposase [Trichonephila clavipes]
MEWSACSPDMNPIEHVWDVLGRRVAGRQPPPKTLQELETALLEEWDRIPQLVINSLIDSMPQRCSTLLDGLSQKFPNDFLNLAALAERAELYAGKLEREESKIRKLTSVIACGQFCRQGHARRRSTYCSRVQQKIDYQYRLQRTMLNSFQAL